MKIEVERENGRYFIHYKTSKFGFTWYKILTDEVINDPLRFKTWLEQIISEAYNTGK